jgi:hypothetical protein
MARGKVVLLGAAGLGVVAAAAALWLLGGTPGAVGPASESTGESSARSDAPRAESPVEGTGGAVVPTQAPATGGRILGRLVRGSPPVPVAGDVTVSGKTLPPRTVKAGEDGRFAVENLPKETNLDLVATSAGLLPSRHPGIYIERRGPFDMGDVLLGPPQRLEVRVRDKGDRPVAGATVSMVRNRTWSANTDWVGLQLKVPPPPSPEATLKTDDKGVVVFESAPPGAWAVLAEADGYGRVGAFANIGEGEAREPVRIVLLPACGLEGTVFAADGKPLPGVTVFGVPVQAPWPQDLYRITATADEQGAYKLAGFAEGAVNVSVMVTPDFVVGVGTVQLPGVRRFDIRLAPGFTVKGKVTDDVSGAAVPGARVTLQTYSPTGGMSGQATIRRETAADGAYALENIPAGNFGTVMVRKEGFLDWPDAQAPQTTWAIATAGSVEERDAKLHRGAAVRGRVLDGSGKPVPNARVQAYTMNPNSGFSQSEPVSAGADGTYRVENIPAGKALLMVTASGWFQPKFPQDYWQPLQSGAVPEECSVDVPKEGEAVKDLVLSSGGVVEGFVSAPDGSPAVGLRPYVQATKGRPMQMGGGGVAGPSDAEGKFRITGVVPGEELTVRASGTKAETGTSDVFRLADGETVQGIRVALKAGGGIAGRVRRDDGKSAQGASIRAVQGQQDMNQQWSPDWQYRAGVTHPVGADGDFRIEGITPGKYSLFATCEGTAPSAAVTVDVPEGSVKEGVDVLLPIERPISGQVVDDARSPVAGARITFREDAGGGGRGFNPGGGNETTSAVSDAEGKFTLPGLGEKSYEVSAEATGFVRESAKTKGGATDVVLVLRRGQGIGGVVVDEADGKPIPDMAITVNPMINTPGPWRGRQGKTGKDGTFLVDGLDPNLEFSVTAGQQWGGKSEHAPKTQQKVKPGTTDLRISLVRGQAISGTLVDEQGAPVNLRVQVQVVGKTADDKPDYQKQRWGQSESDGTFRIGGLEAGVYDVTINSGWNQTGGGFAPASMKGIAAGTEGISITLRKGAPISGKVVDEKGDPIKQQTWMQITPSGETMGSPGTSNAMVQQDGTFTTPALDTSKTYDLNVGQIQGYMGATAKGVAPGAKDVIIRMSKGGSIAGRVVDDAGNAVAKGVSVQAQAESLQPGQVGGQAWAATKEDGTFLLEGLGEFKFKVRAGGNNSEYAQTTADGTHAPGTTDLVVRVKAGVAISGRLLTSTGEGFQSQSIMGTAEGVEGAQPSYTRVGEDGTFTMKGLPAGKVRIKAYSGKDWADLGVIEAPATGVTLTMPESK